MKTALHTLLTLTLVLCLGMLGACAQQTKVQEPLPELTIGVVPFTQPTSALELMAGYIPDNQGKINAADLLRLDTDMRTALNATKRSYTFIEGAAPTTAVSGRNPLSGRNNNALLHWVQVAKDNGVDMIIVPMIINWQERQGGDMGVTTSADVTTDIFLIDARGTGNLLQRSFFDEKQAGLSNNLLDIGTFFKRGGKWLTAEQLSQEGILKAVQEFGL